MKKQKFAEEEDDDDDDVTYPDEIDQCAMQNIVWGSFLDNVGSQALFPLCLSPLAYEQFFWNFVSIGQEPVMSLDGYKWLSALIGLMVIPSANICPKLFLKIGAAAACVFGNTMTGIITISLLYIGSAQPTEAMFGLFVAVMYIGYPFTVISQLTTSPMLDAISPLDKRGYVQGINSTVMNIATAVAPWLLGLLADAIGTFGAIWTGVGISFLAAAVNSPLMFRKGFGPPPKPVMAYEKAMPEEDKDLLQRILANDPSVTIEQICAVNKARLLKSLPYLIVHPRPYEEDNLEQIRKNASPSFFYVRDFLDEYLKKYNEGNEEELNKFISQMNDSKRVIEHEEEDVYNEIGQWFADHLKNSGYLLMNPVLMKLFILSAFPVLLQEDEVTKDNFEQYIANYRRLLDGYVTVADEQKKYTMKEILGMKGPQIYG